MNEIEEKKIENMIYEIRGVQVMLDSDLAELYEVETKYLNRQVKRNIERFPRDFMFQLTGEEYKNILRCQNDTLKIKQGKFSKYLPYVFTEHGVTALTGVLRSNTAIEMNTKIIRTFVKMRHFIMENKDIYKSINNINNKLIEHDEKFDYLFSKFDKKERLFLEGETFDAYYNILSIMEESHNEIIIIDNYADITLLDLIRNIKINITLITKDSNRLSNLEIDKYNSEYHNLRVIRNNSFHDRFIIIDSKEIYLIGSSINNLGNKITIFVKLEDNKLKNILLNNIENIIQN